MAEEYVIHRMIRRIAAWRGAQPGVEDEAFDEVYDPSVRRGSGLSVWKIQCDEDLSVVVAVVAESRVVGGARGKQEFLRIPLSWFEAHDYAVEHTPEGTDSTHARAADLHHDIQGLDGPACLALKDSWVEAFEDFYFKLPKRQVQERVRGELDRFVDEEVRERLAGTC